MRRYPRQYIKPDDIYKKSFSIIKDEFGEFSADKDEMLIRTRIAHTTADIEYAKTFKFHKYAIKAGVNALISNMNIVTDVTMVLSGIKPRLASNYSGELKCFLYDDDIADEAIRRGTTKSAAAITKSITFLKNGIVAIGNAPTALFELIDLVKDGKVNPALIVGVPVGFVGAAESKIELNKLDIPYITNLDRRGGSPVAAAIVNGLIALSARNQNG